MASSVREAEYGVYMDHHASTPLDRRVLDAMMPFLTGRYGNPHSADHGYGWQADAAVELARAAVANVIGAEPEEIVFTSGATEANNLALLGAARAASPTRRRVVVSSIEHKCVLSAARSLGDVGFDVVMAPVGTDGVIDLVGLAELLDERTAIVSVMTVNNEVGSIQPIIEIADLCRRSGALFHTDAAQALTALDLDVDRLGVDLMSLSGHKAYGPKGIGALYVRVQARARLRPIMFGGDQQGGLRPGTLPTALCVGLGEACNVIRHDLLSEVVRVGILRDELLRRLIEREPTLVVNGTLAIRHPANLNLRVPGLEAELVLAAARPRLAASSGSACTSGLPEPSHVLRAMGLDAVAASESIRIGLGRSTDAHDVAMASEALIEAFSHVRSMT